MWIPTNKKTGVTYPPISDKDKEWYETDPALKSKYTFKKSEEKSQAKEVVEPTEAKKVKPVEQ